MIVTRVARSTPGDVGFADGYAYRWERDGQELDVLPQHLEQLLALPGFSAVEVDVIDPPLVLPDFDVLVRQPDTRVPAPHEGPVIAPAASRPYLDLSVPLVSLAVPAALPSEEVEDLTGALIDEPVLPEPEPLPDTAVAAAPPADEPDPVVVVTDLWSLADVELVLEHRPEDDVVGEPSL